MVGGEIMKKSFFFALIIIIAFFVVSCTITKTNISSQEIDQETVDDSITGNAVVNVESGSASSNNIRSFDVRIGNAQSVYDTIAVNQGDTVELNFLSTEPVYFSLDAFQINEYVRTGSIRFTAYKKGSFELLCLNCETSNDNTQDSSQKDTNDKKHVVIGVLNVR
jgi:hypothetical protein